VPKRYPEEFRGKVLDLVAAGRPVAQIAADLGISERSASGEPSTKAARCVWTQSPGLNSPRRRTGGPVSCYCGTT
jgi:hypothetical protein